MPAKKSSPTGEEKKPLLSRRNSSVVEFLPDGPPERANGTTSPKPDNNTVGRQQSNVPPSAKSTNVFMYLSHFLTKWGERMWQFAGGLFMIYINPDSLVLTAVFGLSMGGSVLLLGPVVGDWVDNTQRLKAVRISLVLQTLFVVLCSALIYVFLVYRDELLDIGEWVRYVTYAGIIILSALSLLANTANTITVEKDWIVEICGSDQERLATMTARMRAIDLTTQIMAPAATGQIMAFIGVQWGAIFIAGWNVVTVIFEYYLVWKVYKTIPALSVYKDVSKTVSGKKSKERGPFDDSKAQKSRCRIFSGIMIIIDGWKTFARYEVMLSGLALACLFMTVLGFDNVTVGYATLQGLNESIIGVMMSGAGLLGILGTFAYPRFRLCLGLPRTGIVGLLLLVSCLSACLVSVWLPGSPFDPTVTSIDSDNSTDTDTNNDDTDSSDHSLVSVLVLMSGIIAARFGLWVADLSITQMFMQTVKEEERGVVFGVQNSLNQLMDMLKYGLVTALPLAPQFGLLVIVSFSFIVLGCVFYSVFLCRYPKELFSPKEGAATYTKI